MKCILTYLVFIICLNISSSAQIEDGPLKEPVTAISKVNNKNFTLTFSDIILRFYQACISPAYGDRCALTPSCSMYARLAIQKHGFLRGWIMAFDRLTHESDEINFAPLVREGKYYRFSDPVDNNDFWWKK